MTTEHGHVVLNFEKAINFIAMPPSQAVPVAREILKRAKQASKKDGGGRIPEA